MKMSCHVSLDCTVRDYSGSEGSAETAEDVASVVTTAAVHKQKKKRSVRSKKKSASVDRDARLTSRHVSDFGQPSATSLDGGENVKVGGPIFLRFLDIRDLIVVSIVSHIDQSHLTDCLTYRLLCGMMDSHCKLITAMCTPPPPQ